MSKKISTEVPEDVLLVFLDYETTGVPAAKHYPIEIGVVTTDHNLDELFQFEAMIRWDGLVNISSATSVEWAEPYREGFRFHKIPANNYLKHNRHALAVAKELMGLLKAEDPDHKKKWVLTSDNIQFEYRLTEKLWSVVNFDWPFHYCGWDTSLFLEMVGVGDPANNPHRALADAQMLVEAVRDGARLLNNLWKSTGG